MTESINNQFELDILSTTTTKKGFPMKHIYDANWAMLGNPFENPNVSLVQSFFRERVFVSVLGNPTDKKQLTTTKLKGRLYQLTP